MRLFLASQDFGKFANELRRLARGNQRVLMLANARDYRPKTYIQDLISRKRRLFAEAGFQAEALDLRPYFGDQQQLADFLKQQQPGIIYALGGNVFLLAAALKLSGATELLRKALQDDQFVYAGGSAGAMVTAANLQAYNYGASEEDSALEVRRIYGNEPVFEGLHLIDSYIVPHADLAECAKRRDFYAQNIARADKNVIMLKNTDVYIIDGERPEILRGDD